MKEIASTSFEYKEFDQNTVYLVLAMSMKGELIIGLSSFLSELSDEETVETAKKGLEENGHEIYKIQIEPLSNFLESLRNSENTRDLLKRWVDNNKDKLSELEEEDDEGTYFADSGS